MLYCALIINIHFFMQPTLLECAMFLFQRIKGGVITRVNTVETLFSRGHPQDQGKCPLNEVWAVVC